MATVVSGASAASDLNTVQNFTAGEIVTADDMRAIAYDNHLKDVRRLQSQLSFDGKARVGIIRGFRAATRNSAAMTITVPGGLGIAKVATSEVNDSEHYVCFENDDSVVVTLDVGHGTYDRIDLICARPVEEWASQVLRSKRNTNGSLTTFNVYPNSNCYADLVYVPGTAAASPTVPAADDANDIPLFYIYVPATVTATNTCTVNPIMPLLHGAAAEILDVGATVTLSAGHVVSVVSSKPRTIPDNVVLGAWEEVATDHWRLHVYIRNKMYQPLFQAKSSGVAFDIPLFGNTAYGAGATVYTGLYDYYLDLRWTDGSGSAVPPSGTHVANLTVWFVNDPDRAF